MAVDKGLRVQALEFASRLGLPAKLTLDAARDYLAFMEGTEPPEGEWIISALNKRLIASRKTKAPAKKPPAKTSKR